MYEEVGVVWIVNAMMRHEYLDLSLGERQQAHPEGNVVECSLKIAEVEDSLE